MKIFHLPKNAWLATEAFEKLITEFNNSWAYVENSALNRSIREFAAAQSDAMFLKFFLEQAFGTGSPSDKTLRIIKRDFRDFSVFSDEWMSEALKNDVDWLVFGLSFADFRFHLFSTGVKGPAIPFCISPMMCACLRDDIITLSGISRAEFIRKQWEYINWDVVEQRIECLEKPLDVFEDAIDCVEEVCAIKEE